LVLGKEDICREIYRRNDNEDPHTCVYNIASSEPLPLAFAVNSTQKTLHHLGKLDEKTER
jgi:hypothetical protein